MTSHGVAVLGYLVILGAAVVVQVVALRGDTGIPTIGALLQRATASRSGRVGVVAAWAWIGLHFFGR